MSRVILLVLALVLTLSGCSLWRSLQSAMGNQNAKACTLTTNLVDIRNELLTVDYSSVTSKEVKEFLDKQKAFFTEQRVDTAKALSCGGVAPK